MTKKKEYRQQICTLEESLEDYYHSVVKLSLSAKDTASKLRKAYDQHMADLNPDYHYDLLETLSSGTVITHLRDVSLDELKAYVRKVFIDSVPPMFTFRRTSFESEKIYPKLSLRKTIMQKFFRRE